MGLPGVPSIKQARSLIESDTNIRNLVRLTKRHGPQIPQQTKKYLLSKIPIVQWLPRYSPSWILNDLVAGITIGVLLVPQSLSYATVANIPAGYGLISSWIPMLLYAIMGTSKDINAGPTSIMGLLTGQVVNGLVGEGYTPIAIASGAAFWVGMYSLVLGLFRLGFLLDFIPLPVLSGYVSGAAMTIILQQLKGLFGEPDTGSDIAGVIKFFFNELPQTNWRAFVIGISGIFMLFVLQELGRRLGKKHRAIWYLSISRNAIALILFTLISWGVNKDQKTPLFGISKVTGYGVLPPKAPDTDLLVKLASRSWAIFIAAALEHLAIGKAFGRRHGYEIDQDQELTYIGITNVFGSFFSCMPVTGGFSRTAVNSESGVKSPLSGVLASACVLVSIYKLTGAFYWIPSATLSAIIIVAVWQIVLPPRIFWQYWKTSFADFLGSMVAFWVTLFVSVEIGIAAAVGYSIVYLLLQLAFTRVKLVTPENINGLQKQPSEPTVLTKDSMYFVLQDAILFPNAARVSRQIQKSIYTYSSSLKENTSQTDSDETAQSLPSKDRLWNDSRTRMINSWRKEAGINNAGDLPRLRSLILDMSRVSHIDTTGIQSLADIRSLLRDWAGDEVELRIVGLSEELEARFSRAEKVFELGTSSREVQDGGRVVFEVLQTSVQPKSLT